MRLGWKITSALCVVLLLFVVALCGALLYYSVHPSSLKSLIEKSISQATGTSTTIQSIDYTLHPLSIRLKEVLFRPGEDLKGFCLGIPHASADFILEGPFGNKSLIVRNLKMSKANWPPGCRIGWSIQKTPY